MGVLFIDLEAQYRLTIEHVEECFEKYKDHIEPMWVCLPIHLRNAVSVYEPFWMCWDPNAKESWVRKPHPKWSITDESYFPFFRRGMEREPERGGVEAHRLGGDGMGAAPVTVRPCAVCRSRPRRASHAE